MRRAIGTEMPAAEGIPYRPVSFEGRRGRCSLGRIEKAAVCGRSFALAPKDILALPQSTPYRLEAAEDSVFFCSRTDLSTKD